jgi:two-component system CheB/CheR fusion protein
MPQLYDTAGNVVKLPALLKNIATRRRSHFRLRMEKNFAIQGGKSAETQEPRAVVVIGSSAGGLRALEEFFKTIPSNTGFAYIIAAHHLSNRKVLLDHILARFTKMPVFEISDNQKIISDKVYIASIPGFRVDGNVFRISKDGTPEVERHLSINQIFENVSNIYKGRTIAVLLSGTGSDGSSGIESVYSAGGKVLVQNPESAEFGGMPLNAIKTDCVDHILNPKEIALKIAEYADNPEIAFDPDADVEESTLGKSDVMTRIIALIYGRTKHDFSSYKYPTIKRRMERRKAVHNIQEPKHYLRFLQEHPHEIDMLFREFLINVTSFFRNEEAFTVLAGALEARITSPEHERGFRVWVPACSTGEEAYSIAIILQEIMERQNIFFPVQIFATDLDPDAIDFARHARYPLEIVSAVGKERLERYFIKTDAHYKVKKQIREMVIFAPHNVLSSPPFTRMDLVSCRNLLIYLDSALQKQLIPLFHYSLKPDGLFFMGTSESIGEFRDYFNVVDKKWKIYSKRLAQIRPAVLSKLSVLSPPNYDRKQGITMPPPKNKELIRQIDEALLNECLSPTVIVNPQGDIVHIHGRTGSYLEPSAGEPNNNIITMARDGLKLEITTALRKVLSDKEIFRKDVKVKTNNHYEMVNLTIKKINDPESLRGLILVRFDPQPLIEEKENTAEEVISGDNSELHLQLQYARENLQSTVEELESSNEELKSTNEELQSTNEELQSTNEELETSKEEAQSLNEELQTLNLELQSKIDELSSASDDLTNLLNSTDVATIFLDENLNIKRFTKQARKIINLLPQDVGRSIKDITANTEGVDYWQNAKEVLESLEPMRAEVKTRDGNHYFMRIAPYRGSSDNVAGVVFTFVSSDELRAAQNAAASAELSSLIVESLNAPILLLDSDLKVDFANTAYLSMFSMDRVEVVGKKLEELDGKRWNDPNLLKALREVLPLRLSIEDFNYKSDLPGIGKCDLILSARALKMSKEKKHLIILEVHKDN